MFLSGRQKRRVRANIAQQIVQDDLKRQRLDLELSALSSGTIKLATLKEEEAETSFTTAAECSVASQTRFDVVSHSQIPPLSDNVTAGKESFPTVPISERGGVWLRETRFDATSDDQVDITTSEDSDVASDQGDCICDDDSNIYQTDCESNSTYSTSTFNSTIDELSDIENNNGTEYDEVTQSFSQQVRMRTALFPGASVSTDEFSVLLLSIFLKHDMSYQFF